MRRAYEVKVERGDNWQGYAFVVVAATDEEAVRKAKSQAQKESAVKTGWRCTELRERSTPIIS